VLNRIFKEALNDVRPRYLAVLGCGTGNGFEHVNTKITENVLGIDINPEYLAITSKRYGNKLPGLDLICSDLCAISCPEYTYDIIHGALIFEYVEIEKTLQLVSRWLTKGGVLSVVLQLPSPKSGMISETRYHSLKSLESIMHLVNPVTFDSAAEKNGLKKSKESNIPLKSGKMFSFRYYKKLAD
jgi:ubiquinone/menaquinone biosynthesis C-methylase UbiE